MESFKKMVPRKAHVYRNGGSRIEIDAEQLVVGDIVELKSGDLVPADVRIIQCQNFKVDNSGLTGESEAQKRSTECTHSDPMETKNLAFFSTNAVEGLATGLVVRVGPKTLMGRLATLSSSVESGQSPIGIEMDRFIFIMTMRSFTIGIVFFGIAIFMGYKWLDAIFFIIGIMVANIPEGLSVTFTMILSLTAKRMAAKNCLVKHLQAVEALGSTSVICSDSKRFPCLQCKGSVRYFTWVLYFLLYRNRNSDPE
jgi:sodium/potassium-transporting ATPase subunit alpha